VDTRNRTFPRIKGIRSVLARLADRLCRGRNLLKAIQPFIPVDEHSRTKPEPAMQRVDDKGLCRLIFREKQNRLVRTKLLADHLKQALDLGLSDYGVGESDQLAETLYFVLH
jgi:hypothetical protein